MTEYSNFAYQVRIDNFIKIKDKIYSLDVTDRLIFNYIIHSQHNYIVNQTWSLFEGRIHHEIFKELKNDK